MKFSYFSNIPQNIKLIVISLYMFNKEPTANTNRTTVISICPHENSPIAYFYTDIIWKKTQQHPDAKSTTLSLTHTPPPPIFLMQNTHTYPADRLHPVHLMGKLLSGRQQLAHRL